MGKPQGSAMQMRFERLWACIATQNKAPTAKRLQSFRAKSSRSSQPSLASASARTTLRRLSGLAQKPNRTGRTNCKRTEPGEGEGTLISDKYVGPDIPPSTDTPSRHRVAAIIAWSGHISSAISLPPRLAG
ncbi:hypothetical protein GGTG_07815 [Gaeumannomyces tritici R3-111a-1]|uniref:Uncharacterized protein n=1 Tax=Gaeumannomyces tritici (strain R3-111a-1) TaxID=644352 RepID=J3P2S1_GAET3|nr:hypothetical protein GGTG_07815 [Gaeumannomyces tritici R3-111a-1]EJT73963.1 hypothetical protein GGTG_07815 [Gaeumannomyces tritici R3-111a-1]